MKNSLFFAFPAVLALALAACGGSVPPAYSPSAGQNALRTQAATDPGQMLFLADSSAVDGFALPLNSFSKPVVQLKDVNEPIPVAVGSNDLFVGSFSDGSVFRFALPLTANSVGELQPVRLAPRSAAPAYQMPLSGTAKSPVLNIGTPTGLAADDKFLYVGGSGANGHFQVQAYTRPLAMGQTPAAVIRGFSPIDFLGLATEGDTLFVASVTQGTIAAYSLPLASGERPRFTLHIPPQKDAAIGVATRHHELYVTNYSSGEILVYSLPKPSAPLHLDLKRANHGNNPLPYAVTASDRFLYVTGNAIYQYRLPITQNESPAAIIPTTGFGVAVFPKWAQ